MSVELPVELVLDIKKQLKPFTEYDSECKRIVEFLEDVIQKEIESRR